MRRFEASSWVSFVLLVCLGAGGQRGGSLGNWDRLAWGSHCTVPGESVAAASQLLNATPLHDRLLRQQLHFGQGRHPFPPAVELHTIRRHTFT